MVPSPKWVQSSVDQYMCHLRAPIAMHLDRQMKLTRLENNIMMEGEARTSRNPDEDQHRLDIGVTLLKAGMSWSRALSQNLTYTEKYKIL